jgi:ribosomal protein S18 acetylase RimI-like enzyme
MTNDHGSGIRGCQQSIDNNIFMHHLPSSCSSRVLSRVQYRQENDTGYLKSTATKEKMMHHAPSLHYSNQRRRMMQPIIIIHVRWFISFSIFFQISNGLVVSRSSSIEVYPVQSPRDEIDLADSRYQEWMLKEDTSNDPPSPYAFRMATAEITRERANHGAIAFLAKSPLSSSTLDAVIVGSAELSTVEFEGTFLNDDKKRNEEYWYITDVVTSSQHRRMGIGTALMNVMEQHAAAGSRCNIYLHVCEENVGALRFYQRRGYEEVSDCQEFNAEKLAENADTRGQQLLCKTFALSRIQPHKKNKKKHRKGGGKGFG